MGAPDLLRWLHLDPSVPATEGPFEWLENALLVVCALLWACTAHWLRRDRLRAALAVLLVLQILVVLGEETDWGQVLGLGLPGGQRDLRRQLQVHLGLSERDGALVLMAGLVAFFALPLAPIAPVRRLLDRIAPVHALLGDSLALFALPLAWLVMERIDRGPSTEFGQTGGYLVLFVASLRATLAARSERDGASSRSATAGAPRP